MTALLQKWPLVDVKDSAYVWRRKRNLYVRTICRSAHIVGTTNKVSWDILGGDPGEKGHVPGLDDKKK